MVRKFGIPVSVGAAALLVACGAPGGNACGASAQRGLIGNPVEDMAALSLAAPKVRFITEGDPVTQDEQPERLNVVRDADGIVTRVYCG